MNMISKLNGGLRKLFVVLGAVFVLFKLIEKIEFAKEPVDENELAHEFDDIW